MNNSVLLKLQKCHFLMFTFSKIDFTENLSGRKLLNFPHCVDILGFTPKELFFSFTKCETSTSRIFRQALSWKLSFFLVTPNGNATGCSTHYLPKRNICNSETAHIWPHVGKAKMCLSDGRFFQFSKICLHFSAVCLQFF